MNQFSIKGAIDRFEGTNAVIRTEDGQTLIWPIKNLPDGTDEGEAVRLALYTDEIDRKERESLAKDMLNEILKSEE